MTGGTGEADMFHGNRARKEILTKTSVTILEGYLDGCFYFLNPG